MVLGRGLNIFLVATLAFTLVSGAFFHSVIPHRHSHTGQGEDAEWSALHASLSSEGRKMLAALIAPFALFALCAVTFMFALGIPVPAYARVRRKPDRLSQLLKRGVLAYRKFP